MDFIYLLRVLSKKKWIILGAGLMAAFIAYILTNNLPKKYRSSAQVSTGFTMPDETKPNENFNFAEADTKFNNVIVTFSSPTVVSLLSYKLMLHDLGSNDAFRYLSKKDKESPFYKSINIEQAKEIYQSKLDNMTLLTSYKPEEKKLLELLNLYEYDYKSLVKKLTIYQLQRTDFLQIDFTSENPELSAFVVNSIYDQFLRYYGSVRSAKSRESIDTLKSIMDKKKQVLDQKNASLRDKGVMTANDNNASNIDLINSYNKEIADEENNKTEKTYALQKINQRLSVLTDKPTANLSTSVNNNDEVIAARNAANQAYAAYLNNTSDKSLYEKYMSLKKEYEDKVRQYGTSNDTKTETKTGDDKYDLMTKKTDYELDIQASDEKIKGLKSKVAALRHEIVGSMTKDATVESLLKEEEQANKEYLDAKQHYNDAIDANTASVSNFKLVVPGQPAIEPDPSYRGLIVSLAGVAAIITAILIIIFLAYLDSSIKTPSIFSRAVGLKLISMVNFMNLKNKTLADIISNKKGYNEDKEDKVRNNIFRESLRKLRYEVETSGKKSFLFTSTKKGQGKTTLIQALSYSMSMSKKKILIIDTNFCNNDLTVQLNADPVLEKIIPYKSNKESLLDQVKVFSKDLGVGSVYAIGTEAGDYTPSEILPRENLLQHLDELTADFDYIFLEGPPLNDFSDSKELAQYVDGVIAVFSAHDIIKQIDKPSISFFKELNGKFIGCILNMVDMNNVNTI